MNDFNPSDFLTDLKSVKRRSPSATSVAPKSRKIANMASMKAPAVIEPINGTEP